MSKMTAAEYSDQVAKWLTQAQQWQYLALGFPSYLAYQISLHQQQGAVSNNGIPNGNLQQPAAPPPPFQPLSNYFLQQQQQQQQQQRQQQQQQQQPVQYLEFAVPPLWKRVVAEFLDFLVLFFIKIVITYGAVEYFEIIDLEKYDLGLLSLATGNELDYALAMELTSDLIILEIMHRLIVCTFEMLCTHKGPGGQPGGATPGKLVMGLRIFLCHNVVATANPNRVLVTPASDLGILWASLRAFLKNMSMAFLFPMCFTFFFLPYNRALYDVVSKSIVLEVPSDYGTQRRHQRGQPPNN